MKKSLLVRLIILIATAISLSGCVIWPYGWDDGGHHGGYDRGWHEGHRHWDHD